MISSQSNLSGVVVKGIDPATVGAGDRSGQEHRHRRARLPRPTPEKLRDARRAADLRADEDDDEPARAADEPPRQKPAKSAVALRAAPASARPSRCPTVPSQRAARRRRVVPGVIIGRELAKNLRLYLGDDVNIVSPLGGIGPRAPIPKSKPFRVAGIFFSGMFEYDTKYIYLAIPAAQKFLGMEDEVTGLELKVADPDRTEPVVAALSRSRSAPATTCRTGRSSTATSSRRSSWRRSPCSSCSASSSWWPRSRSSPTASCWCWRRGARSRS